MSEFAVFASTDIAELYPLSCLSELSLAVLIVLSEDHMLLEEWQNICIESPVDAPVCSKCSVVLLCLVNNSEFIQLMRERLIGVHVVKIAIVARPVKLESS